MSKPEKRNSFTRPQPSLAYKKVFHVFSEGSVTEPRYLAMLTRAYSNVVIEVHPPRDKTSPPQILEQAQQFLHKAHLRNGLWRTGDEIWVMVDHDNRAKSEFEPLRQWCKGEKNACYLAFSHPNFEYFLLQHFETGDGIHSSKECEERLKKYLPNYQKNRLDEKALVPRIPDAIAPLEKNISNALTGIKITIRRFINWLKRSPTIHERSFSITTTHHKLDKKPIG